MKGKALRKHSLHEKTAASVLLKLFIRKTDKNNIDMYINAYHWRIQRGGVGSLGA